jgi:hypothetical protein
MGAERGSWNRHICVMRAAVGWATMERAAFRGTCPSGGDPMTIGPIQAFVIGFPDNDLFEGESPRN